MSLQVRDLSKRFAVRTLFSGVTFAVNPGERVALVGPNGVGKTTLMKIILGRETPDTGSILLPRDALVGYLPQEIFLEESGEGWNAEDCRSSLWDLVSQAFVKLRKVEADMGDLEEKMSQGEFTEALQDRYDALHAEFERLGGYQWQARMIRILKGLGFPEHRFHEPLNHFSGGWRMRAYFARLLLSSPDYLLLDEPTNYLDIASIQFLEEYLGNYPGGILMVSHDRYFLDNLANSVVAIMPEGARSFKGNYSEFLAAREYWAQEAEAALRRREKEVSRITKFVERFRYKATKAAQVQSRLKMLEKMDSVQTLKDSRKLDFDFIPCQESGEVVCTGEKLGRSFGSLKVFDNLDFMIYRGDRLAIIGENGAGKSTLMRIIAGQDNSYQGVTKWGFRVFPGYFAQDEEISFEKDETVWERMNRECPLDRAASLRGLLGMFLFSGDMVDRPVRVLSGGEKSRLGLARLLLRPANVLLLDEPTNHLDLASREALLDALDAFPGTLIFVSHDRYFLDSLASRVIALDNGVATMYEGDYSQYLWSKRARLEAESQAGESDGNGKAPVRSEAREDHRARKKMSNQRQRWEKEAAQVEGEISDLEKRCATIEGQLACPPAGMGRDDIAALSLEYQKVKERIDAEMVRWESLHKLLEES